MKKVMALLLAVSLPSMFAQAQEESAGQSSVKASDVTPENKPQEDIDQEITNARMRATLGSKSKWSIKTALGYNGGSLERPGDRVRPNYRSSPNPTALTTLSGSVGVKYSLDKGKGISMGTGLIMRNPLHGDLSRDNFEHPVQKTEQQRMEVSTPSISYSSAYKAAGMQMISDVGYSHYTTSDATKIMKGVGYVSFSQTVLADLGTSGWAGGVSFIAGADIYSAELDKADKAKGYRQSLFDYGLYPFAEYSFNDRYSFRTVFGYFANTYYRDQGDVGDKASIEGQVPYQSIGVGISVTRDIYLYPNVQFVPLDMRADRTNVALSANINVF